MIYRCFPAVLCAERRIKSHLLLRGEQPQIQTGYNLISTMHGNVTYVPRSIYASREKMLKNHACCVAGSGGNVIWLDDILEASLTPKSLGSNFMQKDVSKSDFSRKVVIVNEGAGDVVALLGNWKCYWYISSVFVFVCVFICSFSRISFFLSSSTFFLFNWINVSQ